MTGVADLFRELGAEGVKALLRRMEQVGVFYTDYANDQVVFVPFRVSRLELMRWIEDASRGYPAPGGKR